VAPSLKGTYTVTDNDSPFVLKIENNQLNIYYTVNNVTFKETIADASATQLIITNDDGFKYTYKPFEPITIDK
jgi:negative regulator of sigma E activity